MLGVTVMVPGAGPLLGETLIHDWSSDAVQFIVPPPVLVTESSLAAGFVPPAVAVNDRLVGVTDSAGAVTTGQPLLDGGPGCIGHASLESGIPSPSVSRGGGGPPSCGTNSAKAAFIVKTATPEFLM